MTRLFLSILLGGGVVALAWYAVDSHNEQVNQLRLDLGKEQLRVQFEERASGIHGESNTERRVEELTSTAKWYDSELQALCNQFPGKCDPDAAIKEAEAAHPSDLELRRTFAEETKNLYDAILKGRYKPIQTADLEGVRIDLLSMQRAGEDPKGPKNKIRVDVVVWGAPEQLVEHQDANNHNGPTTRKKQLNFNLRGLDFEFIDDDDKLVGGLNTGGPRFLIDAPDRWYGNFPPQAALAVWWLDPIPADTDHLTMRISGEVKSPSNGSLPISTEWDMKADPDWRVKEGEKFDGETRMMPEEEINRKPHAQK